MIEQWKPVKGYEGFYEVSCQGRVKSFFKGGNILKQLKNRRGYLKVNLYKGGEQRTFETHKLVAMSFLKHIPCGYKEIVDHINNIKTDNHVSNLQLISQRENNSKDRSGNSKYTGVCWHKRDKVFRAAITIDGVVKHLGNFKDELEAAEAYKTALNKIQN